MTYIHTYIVSRHLVTIDNNKILRTPPPHISSSEEILPRLTRHPIVQLRTNKSPLLKSYLHKFRHHITSTTTIVTLIYTTHIVILGFVDRPQQSDCTAGQMLLLYALFNRPHLLIQVAQFSFCLDWFVP